MKKSRLLGAVCACIVILLSSTIANASSVILDTAAPPLGSQGILLNDDIWQYHRFEITSTTQIQSIGGDFSNFTGSAIDIFGAIVQLSSSFDNPDSINLTTSDLLATTIISVGTTRDLYTSPLNITLSPGWYALEFGTGAFSAESVDSTLLIMQTFGTDLAPTQLTNVAFQDAHSSGPAFQASNSVTRYYINEAAVPVPAAVWLFGSGLLSLVGITRRKKAI